MNTKLIVANSNDQLARELSYAADVIKSGGLVVFPTETVYGLGANATDALAAGKIYEAKGRPSDNPLIIHIAEPEDAEQYTETNDTYYRLAAAFMPGPLTVILKAKDTIPQKTRASLPTVAVRCPSNQVARELIRLSGVPIAAPSANLSGSPSPTKVTHVIDDMMGRVDVIIDGGDCDFGLESTIVKIDGEGELTLLRPGKITVDDLLTVIETVKIADAVTSALNEGDTVLSPGMKYRHYAPKAPLSLFDGDASSYSRFLSGRDRTKSIGALVYSEDIEKIRALAPDVFLYDLGERSDEVAHARILFDILRDTDKHNFDEIYAPLPRQCGVGLALYNRLIRAAAYNIIRM